MLIIDSGSDGQNCQFGEEMIRTKLATNKVELSEIPDLKQVVLFNHHQSTEAGWCQVRKYFILIIWRPPLNYMAAAT